CRALRSAGAACRALRGGRRGRAPLRRGGPGRRALRPRGGLTGGPRFPGGGGPGRPVLPGLGAAARGAAAATLGGIASHVPGEVLTRTSVTLAASFLRDLLPGEEHVHRPLGDGLLLLIGASAEPATGIKAPRHRPSPRFWVMSVVLPECVIHRGGARTVRHRRRAGPGRDQGAGRMVSSWAAAR